MKRFFALTLVAFALVVAAPTATSAVPPPDVVPTTECTEMGYCPPSLTIEISDPIEGGGEAVGTATCPLSLEITATSTGIMVVGRYVLEVEEGWVLCSYGPCGVRRYDVTSVTITVIV